MQIEKIEAQKERIVVTASFSGEIETFFFKAEDTDDIIKERLRERNSLFKEVESRVVDLFKRKDELEKEINASSVS